MGDEVGQRVLQEGGLDYYQQTPSTSSSSSPSIIQSLTLHAIQDFMEGIVEFPTHSYGMIDPPKFLADNLESLIGAIFIDTNSSMDETWEVVKRMLQPFVTPENIKMHPVAKFNEACQKNGLKPKAIDMWSQTGEFEIYINDELVGTGKYKSKKMVALNRAANDAYNYMFGKLGNKDGGVGG